VRHCYLRSNALTASQRPGARSARQEGWRYWRPNRAHFEMPTMLFTLHRAWSCRFSSAGRQPLQEALAWLQSHTSPVRLSVELLEDRCLLSGAPLGGAYGQVPLSFEPNLGQAKQPGRLSVAWQRLHTLCECQWSSAQLAARADQRSLRLTGYQPGASVLQMKLVGANPAAAATGLDRQEGISNYFLGNDPSQWHTKVPNYARMQYRASILALT